MGREQANKGGRERGMERRLQAYALRVQGKTFLQIGQALGVSESQAHRDVIDRLRQLATLEQAAAEELRALEVDRLDRLLDKLHDGIEAGDQRSIDSALKIATRRAALLGLDAPEKREVTGANGGPVLVEWGTSTGMLPPVDDEGT